MLLIALLTHLYLRCLISNASTTDLFLYLAALVNYFRFVSIAISSSSISRIRRRNEHLKISLFSMTLRTTTTWSYCSKLNLLCSDSLLLLVQGLLSFDCLLLLWFLLKHSGESVLQQSAVLLSLSHAWILTGSCSRWYNLFLLRILIPSAHTLHGDIETFALLRVDTTSKPRDQHCIRRTARSQRLCVGRLIRSCLLSWVETVS